MPDFARLRAKRLFLLDLDGTLYLDERLFDGAADFLRAIRSRGGTYRFLTNNSSRSVAAYVKKLTRLGVATEAADFLTSVDALIHYLREHGGGIFIFCKLREALGVIYELAADKVAEHRGQARVCLAEPAAVGDAVCDIAELVGLEGIEVVEHAVLEYLAVKSGDAVDAVAAGNAEVRHAHDSV